MTRVFSVSALIFVHAIAFSSVAAAQERLEHPEAGIGITRPVAWHAATLAQVQANRERVRLPDAGLQQALRTRSAMPLFVFTKYAEPHAGLNPSLQVTLRAALPGTPTQLLSTALETMRRAFADFEIVSPVRPVEVGGWPAAHVRAKYTLTNQAGERFGVQSRLWLVPRGRLMFLIGMSGGQAGTDVCEDEFAAALASVTIQK
jgi:hypothetical protein